MSFWRNFLRWAGTKMIIAANNFHKLSDHEYIENCLNSWIQSPYRVWQVTGERYYEGKHDILQKKREILGKDGKMVEVEYLPNHKIIDNQYGKICDQKVNYLLGQPLSFSSDDEDYVDKLGTVFNKRFNRTLQRLGLSAVTGGIAWLYIYVDNNEMKFKVFPGYEILPFWTDSEHTDVFMCARYYKEQRMDSNNPHDYVRKVELYKPDGVEYYDYDGGRLTPEAGKPKQTYLTVTDKDGKELSYNWDKLPLIPFKFNTKEIGLLQRCKSLQDAINNILSKFNDDMVEDARSTILVLENYGGEDLADFRQNLMKYSAVKVESGDGGHGDVRTLKIEVNAQNYEAVLSALHGAMIDNCRGFDFSELKSGNPNNMNIKSILSDLDMDANGMETEFQASFEELLLFVNNFLEVENGTQVDVIFNRDQLINETEITASMVSCGVKVSNKTLLAQLPWVDDAEREQKRVEEQEKNELDAYGGALPQSGSEKKLSPDDEYKRITSR